MLRSIFVTSFLFLVAACPGPTMVDCRVGADCASGVCRRDGTCGPVASTDAGSDAGTTLEDGGMAAVDGGPLVDAGSDGGAPDAGMPLGCLPNNDGRIDRSEVFFQAGLRATYKVSGTATFDTTGLAQSDGGRRWDFSTPLNGDVSKLVETKPLQGEWYESEFPDGGYVTAIGDLMGVFLATPDALYLQGVASPTDAGTPTRLKYTPWVKVLQFPLQAGATWATNTTVSGTYQGLAIGGTFGVVQTEAYQMSVDRAGDAVTPFATFPALRVRTVMARTVAFFPTLTLRSYSWNTECFGTIATATAADTTTTATFTEFTAASEVRRLSP